MGISISDLGERAQKQAFKKYMEQVKQSDKQKNHYAASEWEEQCHVIEYCNMLRIPVVHVPNEGKRSVAEGARQKKAGLQPGFPDLFVPVPNRRYSGLMIEMKSVNGKITANQRGWIELLNRRGYFAVVAFGARQAVSIIEKYMNLCGGDSQ